MSCGSEEVEKKLYKKKMLAVFYPPLNGIYSTIGSSVKVKGYLCKECTTHIEIEKNQKAKPLGKDDFTMILLFFILPFPLMFFFMSIYLLTLNLIGFTLAAFMCIILISGYSCIWPSISSKIKYRKDFVSPFVSYDTDPFGNRTTFEIGGVKVSSREPFFTFKSQRFLQLFKSLNPTIETRLNLSLQDFPPK